MYAPIDPMRRHMEDVLVSLGAVLDAHLARAIVIRQREDGLLIQAQAVATIAERLDGTWSPVERVITHVDVAQAQIAAAARRGARHGSGPIERTLRAVGRLVDERGLRGLTLIQHASNNAWLLWHEGTGTQRATLITLTVDELMAADAAAVLARERLAVPAVEPSREPGRSQRGRRTDGRILRPQLWYGARGALPVRSVGNVFARVGAIPDM